ncbi:hypothetical protein [Paractinoplanes brasiliensis]|uniref:Uncharacterized protein n=1 Tax=Paractinoplanes brasiliensis TaxID=52695 RepID=A0A4R6JWM6_9ACTN|nr:hypothetical protein [Actinoplanes brasiliensis]TDO39586.1 hypothetical protein C8E87_3277 [Actinoplanes brasiliensis]GID29075.1 hypothetical protein Abr02nite_40580 [Actinoplanes brasiliensis]
MSPRTSLILTALAGAGVLLGACGKPPEPLPTSPPYSTPSAGAISLGASDLGLPTGLPTGLPLPTGAYPTGTAYPTGPAYPTTGVATRTTPPPTIPPEATRATPLPSPAPKCTTQPTGAQILALIKGQPGIPDKPMRVDGGPYCSGTWSFTTVEAATASAGEPLMVVATGAGETLTLVAAGSDVCVNRVETTAPPGIRVLACGS